MNRRPVGPTLLVLTAVVLLTGLIAWASPETGVRSNDLSLHLSLSRNLAADDTLDSWHQTDLGYPVLRLYQPLYHLGLVLADTLTAHRLGLAAWARLSLLLLGLAVPLSTFWGIRAWLRAERVAPADADWAAALAALLATLAVSPSGFGYDPLQSIGMRWGIVTQSWATVFLVPALGLGIAWLLGQAASPWPALALGFLTCGTSLIVGVWLMAGLGFRALLAAVLGRDRSPLLRLATYLLGAVGLTAFLWWPLLADAPWVHYASRFFDPWVNDGFAPRQLLGALARGTLLDGYDFDNRARPPILTAWFLASALFLSWRTWRTRLSPGLRQRLGLVGFLLGGWLLWLSLALGRHAWGPVLYLLPVVSSYQWGRFEAMLGLFATVVAALGTVEAARALSADVRPPRRWLAGALAVAVLLAVGLLARAPLGVALRARAQAGAQTGEGARLVRQVAGRLEGDPARTMTGGPTTWEKSMVIDGAWIGVGLVEHGVPVVGRIFQGMGIAAQCLYLWDGHDPWGQALLGVGNWLAPCDVARGLPLANPPRPLEGGLCLGLSREPPPLAFFSSLAAGPPRPLTADQVLDGQRALLAAPGRDVFVPFRLARDAQPGPALPPETSPLVPLTVSGYRMTRVAPGVHASRLEIEAAAAGAVVFPVPYHPGLRGEVDGAAARPYPVLPGFAALPVAAGRHTVTLSYGPARAKDALFLLAVAALGIALLGGRPPRQPASTPGDAARTAEPRP